MINSIDFNSIYRSHLYWDRKDTFGLGKIFKDLKAGDILLDPFCGGGTPIVAALQRGARVIASDINPMALFLSRVLISPVALFALKEAFKKVENYTARSILENYSILCPKCGKKIYFNYLKWNNDALKRVPESVYLSCHHCGLNKQVSLSKEEITRQIHLSNIEPKHWFPTDPICGRNRTAAKYFCELFTGRNLTSLSILHNSIEKISSVRCRDILHYVFTGMLFDCSLMQNSLTNPLSSSSGLSGGWLSPGFYIHQASQEKNIWKVFVNRFKGVLRCKIKINSIIDCLRISGSIEDFESSCNEAYIYQSDFLNISFPKKLHIKHVFLDPPSDIDYIGLSNFWSCWLGMDSSIQADWLQGGISNKENAEKLFKLLLKIGENTDSSCIITLFCNSKKEGFYEITEAIFKKAGYELSTATPIWESNIQNSARPFSSGIYLSIKKRSKKLKAAGFDAQFKIDRQKLNELKFFSRVAAFLHPDSSPEEIFRQTANLIKSQMVILLSKIEYSELGSWISDSEINRKAYQRLALTFFKRIFSKDGFRIVAADKGRFDDSKLDNSGIDSCDLVTTLPMPCGLAKGTDFVAEDNNGCQIYFCFYEEKKADQLKQISKRIFEEDKDRLQKLCFLILPNHQQLFKCRKWEWSDNWPRGFFVEFEKLAAKAKLIDDICFGRLAEEKPKTGYDLKPEDKIRLFNAKVLSNMPVGAKSSPEYFLLRFKAPELKYVLPGQFLMVDTLSYAGRKSIEKSISLYHSSFEKDTSISDNPVDLAPVSFLKRPFGIYRSHHKNFKLNCFKNIALPSTLAGITEILFPHEFEILYKLVEDGTGTNELRKMKQNSMFQVLGPLGKETDLSRWQTDGIDEVHLIGGGVGMAPLIFFGQALRYYSFKVKAFIGVNNLDTLPYDAPATQNLRKSYLFIDDLLSIGLNKDDIHLAYEKQNAVSDIYAKLLDRGLLEKNFYKGLVISQYQSYIAGLNKRENILVISCGPIPMMKSLSEITSKLNIPMKVLMEKRMGCGIGVCMSCVCRTKKNDIKQYSRVCTDGPLFDSNDIDWNEIGI